MRDIEAKLSAYRSKIAAMDNLTLLDEHETNLRTYDAPHRYLTDEESYLIEEKYHATSALVTQRMNKGN